jgi:hypothetical protein
MSESALFDNLATLGVGITPSFGKGLNQAGLILIYSAIDVVGWLASPKDFVDRDTFMGWVDRYLLPAKPLDCTALDLYAARCGMLHTLTPYARPFKNKKPRLICYAYNQPDLQSLRRSIELGRISDRFVAVKVADLFEAWLLGIRHFIEGLEKNEQEKRRVYEKADQFFTTVTPAEMRAALANLERLK